MAMVTGTVEAVSTKYDKYSIMVNDTWYGTKMEWAKVKPNKGDEVEFDDGGAKYLKKVRIVKAGEGSPASSGGKSGYSQVGVEVGHATNIAIQVMDQLVYQRGESEDKLEVGSKEYWEKFCEFTDTVHDITDAFRTKYSAPRPGSAPKAKPEAVESDDDLF